MTSNKNFWPEHLFLELTSRCNLRCVMCAIPHDSRRQKGGEWYGDLVEKAFNNLEPVLTKIKRIDLNGHGESLMNPRFLEILEKMKKSVPVVAMTSNAMMISDNIAEAIVKNRMNEIIVSIHAADEILYSAISRNGSLERVLKNLKKINEYKKMYGTHLPCLKIQFVAMKRNIAELPKMLDLAKELGVTDLLVLPLQEYESVKGEALYRHPDLVKKYIPLAIKRSWKTGVRLHIPIEYHNLLPRTTFIINALYNLSNTSYREYFRIFEYFQIYWNKFNPFERKIIETVQAETARKCIDPWNLSFVTQNGSIQPCCMIPESMGNITERPFEEIWYGEKYSEVKKNILSNNPPSECRVCINRPMTTLANLRAMVTTKVEGR